MTTCTLQIGETKFTIASWSISKNNEPISFPEKYHFTATAETEIEPEVVDVIHESVAGKIFSCRLFPVDSLPDCGVEFIVPVNGGLEDGLCTSKGMFVKRGEKYFKIDTKEIEEHLMKKFSRTDV